MKKALIVGINYAGTDHALRGCINDARNMQFMLEGRGYTVELMLEEAATAANMIAGMERLVADTRRGDAILFHFSGHGSQLPSRHEKDGFEEILCPIDLNWLDKVITDDTLRSIFSKSPRGVNTTLVLDCCHSGDGLDQDEAYRVEDATPKEQPTISPLSPEIDKRYLTPPPSILAQLEGTELVEWSTTRDINRDAMLIAGCRAEQTSADAFIEGTFQGAATFALITSVRAEPSISYIDLINKMNQFMMFKGFEQRPQLDGWGGLHTQIFAEPWNLENDVVVIAPTQELPVEEPEEKRFWGFLEVAIFVGFLVGMYLIIK
jgi:hypothetical protein